MNENDRLIIQKFQTLRTNKSSCFLIRNLNTLTHRIKFARFFVVSILPKPFRKRVTLYELVINFVKLCVLKVLT